MKTLPTTKYPTKNLFTANLYQTFHIYHSHNIFHYSNHSHHSCL